MIKLADFERCVFELSKLPGIGKKTATRLALHLLKMTNKDVESLVNSINKLKTNIKFCKECGSLTDKDICYVCLDEGRDRKTICVVEEAKDVIIIENSGIYKGLYHVLGGRIAPLDGITPDMLSFEKLLNRVGDLGVTEVIIATNPDVDGETTAYYLKKLLADYDIRITRIASGLAVGTHIEYSDEFAILKALENRVELK
ncbi:DNA recombination protein RecR [Deferribacter desulfuricans SSM1]|uniref:Recombination protein RecR n=1 Tax=Deferribacter desulfuricans (strain DSM 14783 / JCM 11476 / NBRC 101012 / SSM1) TaxID=639282 RepID=D3PAN2_DEFDS|nr:recombination mediator RecR [Deferribacter desulfuricans]BAI79655.1 DNA recombination protein RecR [Deferribacter desulfuricans SSM1]